MKPDEFRAVRSRLGLSAAKMGAVLGVHGRTIRKWEAGDSVVPSLAAVAVGLLLRLDGAALAAALTEARKPRERRDVPKPR